MVFSKIVFYVPTLESALVRYMDAYFCMTPYMVWIRLPTIIYFGHVQKQSRIDQTHVQLNLHGNYRKIAYLPEDALENSRIRENTLENSFKTNVLVSFWTFWIQYFCFVSQRRSIPKPFSLSSLKPWTCNQQKWRWSKNSKHSLQNAGK